MIDYRKYNLIYDNDNGYTIGYKSEIIKMLKDNLINYIEQDFEVPVLEEELERLALVIQSDYDNNDLIRVEDRTEDKYHNKNISIIKVSVLVPYRNGFKGADVLKYLT